MLNFELDANGDYTKKFIAELKNVPDKTLFNPWAAPESVLKSPHLILDIT